MEFIDLSMPISPNPSDPNMGKIIHWSHQTGGKRIGLKIAWPKHASLKKKIKSFAQYLIRKRRIDARSFPNGLFLGNEFLTLSVHCSTHIDAPFHYGPICEGKPAKHIGDLPLEWFFGDGVILRFLNKKSKEVISLADIHRELDRIQYNIKPMDIVLIHTGADLLWPNQEYFTEHLGMSLEGTRFLVEQGVKIIGIDTIGFDLPIGQMVNAYFSTGDSANLWPCHFFGREKEYLQIERLGNLHKIPLDHGFKVVCFPIVVEGAGAGWVRPVAFW